jgi:hypothetical protein
MRSPGCSRTARTVRRWPLSAGDEPGAVEGGWGCAASGVETHTRRMRANHDFMAALWHQDVGKPLQADDTFVGR